MKRITLSLTCLLSGLLLLVAVPAFASIAPMSWTISGNGGGSLIDHVTITELASYYEIEMFLSGPATTGNSYQVLLSETEHTKYIAAASAFNVSDMQVALGSAYKVTDTPRIQSIDTIFDYGMIDGEMKFLWLVQKGNIEFDQLDFSAMVLDAKSGILESVHATPIPAAAWLFVSGLLGLIGLKRKNMRLA